MFPICENHHWFLVLVVNPGLVTAPEETNINKPLIILLDSMGKYQSNTVRAIRNYLSQEWGLSKERGGNFQFSEEEMKLIKPHKPEQTNHYDCGIFLLHYLERIFAR